ncbi:MAG: c-type cytochrome [Betaproteobacteria bacterium]|nr:c-type cytochrome [Rhodocyclales bacterium]
MRLHITGVAFAIGLSFSAVTQAGGISGSNLGNTCAGCHGVNGASAGTTMPVIGGLPKSYIETAMKQYRDGSRSATVMGRIAKGYNDAQIAAMSEFFARQAWVSATQNVDANLAKLGSTIHAGNCENCHEKNGTVIAEGDAPPRLAGQWTAYLQLYMDGVNDPAWLNKHPKKGTFGKTTKSDVDAVLQFYASQK